MSMMGWGYAQNTKCLFRAELIHSKHHFWLFLVITIAVCQIQNDFNTHTSSLWGWWDGDMRKNFMQIGNYSLKTPFFVVSCYNNCSVSNPNDFNTYTSSLWGWWHGDMRKTQKFFSERKWFLENTIFGYNNCSVSNPNDFNTHICPSHHGHLEEVWELKSFGFDTLQML